MAIPPLDALLLLRATYLGAAALVSYRFRCHSTIAAHG